MRRILFLLIISLSLAAHASAANKRISEDSCRTIAKRFEALSNIRPEALANEAQATLSILKQGPSPNYYFICYNIYVENLFNQGQITQARREIKNMLAEAIRMDNAECLTVARRAEGQFYYKLGMYERAAECFRKGMATCPDYKQLRSYFTYSSTATWLAQTDLHLHQLNEAQLWLQRVDQMMTWLDQQHKADPSGHNQVRVKALMAQLRIAQHTAQSIAQAKTLLSQCQNLMHKELPKRAYTDYYVAEMQMAMLDGDNTIAINLLDTLINIHRDYYRPICLEYMEQKAHLLDHMGHCSQTVALYRECIKQNKQIDNVAVTQQLDEIRTEYQVEILQRDLKNETNTKRFAALACLLLLIIVIVWAYANMRRKNSILINNIRQQELSREIEQMQIKEVKDAEQQTQLQLGRQIVDYMKSSHCYLQPDYGRSQILLHLGITDRQMTLSVARLTSQTFTAYASNLRLDHSVTLLSHTTTQTTPLSIDQISRACGFGTIRQFQRQFKARFGVSPSDYIAELSEHNDKTYSEEI